MMPLTLSLPLVLAGAGGDAAVVAGMASVILAAGAPVAFDFMVSPGLAGTAHDRGMAHPSSPRRHWPGYWPAGVRTPGLRRLPHSAVLTGWCLATAARRALRVPGRHPEPNGEQVITMYTHDQLLDKLDELTGEREP